MKLISKITIRVLVFAVIGIMIIAGEMRLLMAQAPARPSTLSHIRPAERRTALVIGNADYPHAPLLNPAHDAQSMVATLNLLGFDVISVINGTRVDMQNAILTFAERLADGGAGVFYYAGHGLQVRGQNYLVPIDENITSEGSVRFESISLDAILEQMGQPRPNRTNIIILDACRNNPYASRYGGSAAGLALVDSPTDFFIAYATSPGGVALDGEGDNGLYTGELLKAMAIPDLKVEDIFKRVRANVARQTGHQQIPWEASSLVRDFIFYPSVEEIEVKVAQQVVEPEVQSSQQTLRAQQVQSLELAFWEAIKNSQNAEDYEAYLKAFPNGVFAPLAKIRAERYKRASQQPQVATGPAIEEIEGYYSVTTPANVREAPTANSKRVGTLATGTQLLVTGKVADSNWYRIETPDGTMGYIFGGLIQESTPKEIVAHFEKKQAEAASKSTVAKPAQEETKALPGVPGVEKPKTGTGSRTNSKAGGRGDSPTVARLDPREPPSPAGTLTRQIFQDCPACPVMVEVGPGRFMMGSKTDRAEQPVHRVTIPYAFAIGQHEVTYGNWKACVEAGGCSYTPELSDVSDDMPMRNVSWHDAQDYVTWLSEQTGRPYRLPTEAEWEYAARANTETAYWWGEEPGSGEANCKDCGGNYDRENPMPVGFYAPNPFGLYDTSGGVWEWVEDCWYSSYEDAPGDGHARDEANCTQRVLRGGSWLNTADYLRSATRFYYDAAVRYPANGFRVALPLE